MVYSASLSIAQGSENEVDQPGFTAEVRRLWKSPVNEVDLFGWIEGSVNYVSCCFTAEREGWWSVGPQECTVLSFFHIRNVPECPLGGTQIAVYTSVLRRIKDYKMLEQTTTSPPTGQKIVFNSAFET